MINWNKCVSIDSNTILTDVEHHFRIFAGPGAGKTYWLINHIRNTLQNSQRLGIVSKIACITYTNTGVEEIQKRLQQSAERVEVSTIHSFLYSNVVKPFFFLIKDETGIELLNGKNIDGHEEHIPSFSKVSSWIRNTLGNKKYYLLQDHREVLYDCLKGLDWKMKEGQLILQLNSSDFEKAKAIRLPNKFFF